MFEGEVILLLIDVQFSSELQRRKGTLLLFVYAQISELQRREGNGGDGRHGEDKKGQREPQRHRRGRLIRFFQRQICD